MPTFILSHNLSAETRDTIRKEVTNLFLTEIPGNGKGALCSKYKYTVESFGTYSVVLERPARLNKGYDFTVNIPFSGYLFKGKRKHHNPSHDDVISALLYSQANFPSTYIAVKKCINDFYQCNDPVFASTSSLGTFPDHNGNLHPIEIILLAIKWLFIEQDITYWNWSGRAKLYSALQTKGLV